MKTHKHLTKQEMKVDKGKETQHLHYIFEINNKQYQGLKIHPASLHNHVFIILFTVQPQGLTFKSPI